MLKNRRWQEFVAINEEESSFTSLINKAAHLARKTLLLLPRYADQRREYPVMLDSIGTKRHHLLAF